MNNPHHRYKIWQLMGDGRNAQPAKAAATRQVEDLVALMALYDYRPFIEAELRGSCSLPNGSLENCKTKSVSADSVSLVYDPKTNSARRRSDEIKTGSKIQLNLEQIGTFHGVVASKKPEELQVAVDESFKPMLKSKLSYMAAEHAIGLHEGDQGASRNVKIEPAVKNCSFIDHTGTLRQGVVVNLSQTDALIKARIVPPVRSRIIFRGTQRRAADVTNNFELGFAVKFCNQIATEDFSAAIKLSDD